MDSAREISVPTLAYRLGCTIPHAQTLIRTGCIPGRKTERGWVTTEDALAAYVNQRSVDPTASRVEHPTSKAA